MRCRGCDNERDIPNRKICSKCFRAQQKVRIQGNVDYVQEYKTSTGCTKCGYNKTPYALHLHHVGDKSPKLKGRAHAYRPEWSRSRIDKELANCEVLCANCHLEEHYLNET